ncbi:MAG: hypothetical protein ACK55I_11085, partial [bacterium]
MARVERPAVLMVEDGSVGGHHLQQHTQVGLEEIPFNLADESIDPGGQGAPLDHDLAQALAEFLGGHEADHQAADPLRGPGGLVLRRHQA